MAMRTLCTGVELPDPKSDYRDSVRLEQYRFGREAIYFPGYPAPRYLPYAAIRQAWTQNSSMPVIGTCGKALPVTVLRIRYQGKFYHTLTFEKPSNAQKALDIFRENGEHIVFGPEPTGPRRAEWLAALPAD